jgi:hypothetical protein
VGTLVLTTTLAAFTEDRSRARVAGYTLHFIAGLFFALVYYAVFAALDRAGWRLGMLFGLVHVLFAGTALVNVLLPAVPPRMGTPDSAANSSPLLEAPGFMRVNYGRATPAVSIVAHLAYGAIVGWFISGASN